MISIEGLRKYYGSHEVLKGISLQLETGRVYGIVGDNGAGKTTFFRCLAGLESYAGQIERPPHFKDRTGLLPTDPYFMSFMTGAEYLRLLCQARGAAVADVGQFNLFELPLQQYADTYSTGMKKKLALTGLLLQGNDFFLLDEPYNGVDMHSNMLINKLLKAMKSQGKTILLSSHIFANLRELCDEILWLQAGSFSQRVLPADFDALEQAMSAAPGQEAVLARLLAR